MSCLDEKYGMSLRVMACLEWCLLASNSKIECALANIALNHVGSAK